MISKQRDSMLISLCRKYKYLVLGFEGLKFLLGKIDSQFNMLLVYKIHLIEKTLSLEKYKP